ncbi:MAG: hypothetical protein IPI93_12790 [Sphingobacteriaceae bacterium]|nr:hypothetical protein [Sphingobacteriaceae bacterium]
MNVIIRKRQTSKDKSSLSLEITKNGKRRVESLGLFLYNIPKTKEENFENKQTMALAEHMRAQRLIEDKTNNLERFELIRAKKTFLITIA